MNAEITPTPNGPLHAERIKALKNDRGETIDMGESIYLCRCGASKQKPSCDGSHNAAGFSDKRVRPGKGSIKEFAGKEISVVDDFSLCAHAGKCVDGAPETFFTKGPDGRVSHPDASPAGQVMAAIRRCPSGSLLYKLRGKLVHDYSSETSGRVEKDGPLRVHRAKLNGGARPGDGRSLCALPVRRGAEQAILRRHAREDRISRHLRIVSRKANGAGAAAPGSVVWNDFRPEAGNRRRLNCSSGTRSRSRSPWTVLWKGRNIRISRTAGPPPSINPDASQDRRFGASAFHALRARKGDFVAVSPDRVGPDRVRPSHDRV